MLRALKAGMVAADVGANYGYYSILMGRCVGPGEGWWPSRRIHGWQNSCANHCGSAAYGRSTRSMRAAYSTTGDTVRFFASDERAVNGRVTDEAPYEGKMIDVSTTCCPTRSTS